jgi:hypothetical protein
MLIIKKKKRHTESEKRFFLGLLHREVIQVPSNEIRNLGKFKPKRKTALFQ